MKNKLFVLLNAELGETSAFGSHYNVWNKSETMKHIDLLLPVLALKLTPYSDTLHGEVYCVTNMEHTCQHPVNVICKTSALTCLKLTRPLLYILCELCSSEGWIPKVSNNVETLHKNQFLSGHWNQQVSTFLTDKSLCWATCRLSHLIVSPLNTT